MICVLCALVGSHPTSDVASPLSDSMGAVYYTPVT